MSSLSSTERPPTLELAQMLLNSLGDPDFLETCASDSLILQSFREVVTASYTTTRGLINVSRPINRLPPDILTRIFSLVRCQLTYQRRLKDIPIECMFDVRGLRPLILTCRYWNTLVTGTPSLWSTVSRARVQLVSLSEQLCDRFLSYATGADKLYLHICQEYISPSVMELCRQHGSLDVPERVAQDNFARGILPESSRLRSLFLHAPIPTTTFPALRTLHFERMAYVYDNEALLDFLAGTPQLQELVLSVQNGECHTEFSYVGRVPLPHLETLEIKDDTFAANRGHRRGALPTDDVKGLRQLLAHISVPRYGMRSVELSTIPINVVGDLLEGLNWGTELQVSSVTVKPSHGNHGDLDYPRFAMTLHCANACKIKLLVLNNDVAPPARCTSAQDTCASFSNLFASARSGTFTSLRGLWLTQHSSWVAYAPPHSILHALPRLSMLVVYGDAMRTLYSCASRNDYDPHTILNGLAQDAHGTIPCPLLHTLVIPCPYNTQRTTFLPHVCRAARSRADAGHPLARAVVIELAGSTERKESVDTLRLREYSPTAGGDLELLQEKAGREADVYRQLRAEWERLTNGYSDGAPCWSTKSHASWDSESRRGLSADDLVQQGSRSEPV
ncbi:hypothetical protein BC628DRAFT_855846 [Trametes gibbosa]|nr:hypothetical protein BC628DRAFT_855846 [Trametes gibbosa]